jgi:SAM-dependent methyltransferase
LRVLSVVPSIFLFEAFFRTKRSAMHNPAFFDNMFRDNTDPWCFKTRWYETRKRALTMACLPSARYQSGFEPGCANGELSAELATRCDRLLISDGSALAVKAARERLQDVANVEVRQLWLPEEWPEDAFDLVVISELAYYFSTEQLNVVSQCVLRSLTPNGTVLACHWRHPIDGCKLRGDDVHDALLKSMAMPHLSTHAELDFRLDVWSRDARSVAQREDWLKA